ncbi:MAG: PAS domain S-box protein [Spirulina sp. DLM2.Bin59]|nr:MAG: PAS domain S-box protein [Spirulina sp. DLM2.Bin59]
MLSGHNFSLKLCSPFSALYFGIRYVRYRKIFKKAHASPGCPGGASRWGLACSPPPQDLFRMEGDGLWSSQPQFFRVLPFMLPVDLINRSPGVICPEASLTAAIALLHRQQLPLLWVCGGDGQLLGLLPSSAIFAQVLAQPSAFNADRLTVGATMLSPPPVLSFEDLKEGQDLQAWFTAQKLPLLPVVDGEGKLLGAIAQSDYLTAQLAAERAVHHESASHYQSLIKTIPDLIIRYDRNGKYLEMLCGGRVQLLNGCLDNTGADLWEVLPPHLASQRLDYIQRTLESGEMQRYEYDIEVAPGKWCHEEAYISVAGADQVIMLIRDISERVNVQSALAQEKALMQSLIDSIPDLIIYKDLEGVYRACNQSARGILEKGQDEIIGKTDFELFPEVIAQNHRDHDLHALNGRMSIRREKWVTFKDGTQRLLEIEKTPFVDAQGKILGIIGVGRDVTDRERAIEDLLNNLIKEKEVLDLKSDFITIASHEFRTPLTVIMASAKLMRHCLDRFTPNQQIEQLDQILRSSDRILALLEDILVLNQADADKLNFIPAACNLEQFCQTLYQEIVTTHSSTIQFHYIGSPNCVVTMDEKLLRYILNNLLSNGIKYTLERTPIEFIVTVGHHYIQFTVTDQGIGIPPDALNYVFQPFYRAKNVGNIPGTGLGLAIAKQAVDLHGGVIDCRSQLGQGTTFTVRLPRSSDLTKKS